MVGFPPLRGRPFRIVRKNGIRVPSLDLANRGWVSYRLTSTGGFDASNAVLCFVSGSYRNTVVGYIGELNM
jgi:hypothetical protein